MHVLVSYSGTSRHPSLVNQTIFSVNAHAHVERGKRKRRFSSIPFPRAHVHLWKIQSSSQDYRHLWNRRKGPY